MSNSNNNNLFNGIDKTAPISDIAQQILMRAFNVVQVNEDGDDLYDDDLEVDIDLDDDLEAVDDDDLDLVAVALEGGSYAA